MLFFWNLSLDCTVLSSTFLNVFIRVPETCGN